MPCHQAALIAFDFIGVDFIYVKWRIGHHKVDGTEQAFVRVVIVGNSGFTALHITFKAMYCQIHFG